MRSSVALLVVLDLLVSLSAQQASPPQAPVSPETSYMRVLLKPTHPPVFDAQHRPITAGGFVEGAPVVFEDITHQSGIDKFHHRSGTPEKSTIIEVPGSGVALLDYDNDGWPDIYVANFGKNRLYHNNHDGTFTDVAETASVALGGWSAGPSWGDYDHD